MTPQLEKTLATCKLATCKTVAAKIRALAAAGYPRAEIARLLGKRYQHVRNALEEPGPPTLTASAADGMAEADVKPFQYTPPHTYFLTAEANGSVVLPPEVLKALGSAPGGLIVADLGEESFTLVSGMTEIRLMKARLEQPYPPGLLGSEALIEDRRRWAAIETLESQIDRASVRRED